MTHARRFARSRAVPGLPGAPDAPASRGAQAGCGTETLACDGGTGSGGPAAGSGRGSGKLRVVVFTSGPLVPVHRVLFERLAVDPLLTLCAVVVDDHERPKEPAALRLLRGLREGGAAWLAFQVTSRLDALVKRVALFLFESVHARVAEEESYDAFQNGTGVPVHRVADVHGEPVLALIRSLAPHLGAIVGGRALPEEVLTIPRYGTIDVSGRNAPPHRGGGAAGYWEVLSGERSIGLAVRYATPRGDAGPVLRETSIPIEECDTLESLRIKAEIAAARLGHEAIRAIALGYREASPLDAPPPGTRRSPSPLEAWRLQRRLKRRAAQGMPCFHARPSWLTRARVVLQYAVLLPWLLRIRDRFIKERRAPLCILFYHLVANRPAHHLCIPLEQFVRQVEFLRRYYRVVPLEEAVARLDAERNDEILVSITFDDGYRENAWAIAYLQYFGIPASFFVSIGHVRDGSPFAHDRRAGSREASPMGEEDVRRLVADGFLVGSHGIHHEDFGTLDAAAAERILRESRQLIGGAAGQVPEHFSFPKGQRRTNITAESFELALRHYRYVYSAYGGFNYPRRGWRHFLRNANPLDVVDLATTMDGYTGFRECVLGNAWGLKTARLLPY